MDKGITIKDKKKFIQFSKILIIIIFSCCAIWITWSYVLATMSLIIYENTQPLEELSKQITVTVLGCAITFFAKSYIETYSEKKNDLEYAKFGQEVIVNEDNNTTEESVG